MMRFHGSRPTPRDTQNIAHLSLTQWCLERHDGRHFPLQYGELLPTSGPSPDAAVPDGERDREMIKVLQNNWTNYANLTRSRTRGYVINERQIPLEFDALRKDQSDQEDVRVAAKNLSGKQRPKTLDL
jgi:hypothetical protein